MQIFIKKIFRRAEKLKENLPETKRYFYYMIKDLKENNKDRMALVHGIRGVGKTIALLQNLEKEDIYLKADDIGFKKHKLYEVVENIYNNYNIKTFLIDEIHSYNDWQTEIKNIYDDFPDIKIIMSSSSSISVKKNASYLSRRVRLIEASPMRFYEYVSFKTRKHPHLFSLEEIIENPLIASLKIEKEYSNIYYMFQEYLRFGGLPIYFSTNDPLPLIVNSVKKIIYQDIPNIIENTSYRVLKRLEDIILYLAMSKPGEFSYDTLAKITSLSKGSVYELINALNESDLINFLTINSSKSSVRIRKRIKIYFSNSTIRHSILTESGEEENIGAYREEFFFQHIKNIGKVSYCKGLIKEPDFELRIKGKKYLFEIGKHRDKKIKENSNFINIYDSDKEKYPLYLFGFLKISQYND